uniref:Ionotropic receptor 75a N-terminal domain-containing protein n=1 Tax=Anopheles maculatus TaxID=74869 RepID=A0A182S5E5_9DIPT
MRRIWVIPLLYLVPTLAMRNEHLVVDLVNWYQLKVVYIFHCFNQQHEFIHLVRSVRRNCPNSVAFVNVASFSEQKFVTSLESVHVRVGLMADLNCRDVNSLLPILSERGYFNGERYRWFLYGLRALEQNRKFLRRLNVTVSTNALLFLPGGADCAILDVCGQWMTNGWYVTFLQIGSWSTSTGLITTAMDGGMQDNRAYGLRLWNVISKRHYINITENLTVDDKGQLMDFIIEPIEIKQTDIHKLDYTAAVQDTETILLFFHPNVDRLNNSFLRPFRPLTRLAIGALFVVFSLLMYKALKFEQHLNFQQDRENGFLVLVLGILCQQGFIESSRTYASRITLFSMLIFSMLVYQFYLTYIVSLLLVVPPKNIQTFKQLVQYDFGVALENVPETVEFLNVGYQF